MIDPKTCTIQGDLSRQDVCVLVELCAGKRVVEMGMGGSTLILARCVSELYSYESDQYWLDLTKGRIKELQDQGFGTTPKIELTKATVPGSLPDHDILWLDGTMRDRANWVQHFAGKQSTLIMHDSRAHDVVKDMLVPVLASQDLVLAISSIELHYHDSNMIVVRFNDKPMRYINWNEVEKSGRADWDNPHYVA